MRAGVAEWDAGADDGVWVVAADHVDDNIALLGAEPGSLLGGRATGLVGYRGAGYEDRVDRSEDAALAQRADDVADVGGGEQFL